jgi:hypothetical protein
MFSLLNTILAIAVAYMTYRAYKQGSGKIFFYLTAGFVIFALGHLLSTPKWIWLLSFVQFINAVGYLLIAYAFITMQGKKK